MTKHYDVFSGLDPAAVDDLGPLDPISVEKCAAGGVIVDDKILRHLSNYVEVNLFNFRICKNDIRLRRPSKGSFLLIQRDVLAGQRSLDEEQFRH